MEAIKNKPWIFSSIVVAAISVVYISVLQLQGVSMAANGAMCPATGNECNALNCSDDCPMNCIHNANS